MEQHNRPCTTSQAVDALRERLELLRSSGVASARFDPSGQLCEVIFFPPAIEPPGDVSPEDAIMGELEKAQLRLATGAHRQREMQND